MNLSGFRIAKSRFLKKKPPPAAMTSRRFSRGQSAARPPKSANDIKTLKELLDKFKKWTGVKARVELKPEENAASQSARSGGQSLPSPRLGFQPSSTVTVGARLGVKGSVNFDEVLRPSVFVEWRNKWKGEDLIVAARHTYVVNRTAFEIKTGERFWRANGFSALYEKTPDGARAGLESFVYLNQSKKK